jgi:transposase
MMGERRVMQEALFYGFSLERHVPDNHLLRKIDRFVDLSEVRTHLGPYYSDVERPSIDPELMIRMLIVGYSFGIRSERRLCDEVHLNLAYRWFCRLGLDGDVPDHSTFSKNRHGRFRESDRRHLRPDKGGATMTESAASDSRPLGSTLAIARASAVRPAGD